MINFDKFKELTLQKEALIKPGQTDSTTLEEVKQQVIPQLETQFPKTTKNKNDCHSRYVHIEYKGKDYTVIGKPTYEHNISDDTYTLKSIEYRVEEGRVVTTNDAANNIVENMPVDGNTDIKDLQDQLSKLMEQIKEKTEKLRKLMNSISGNGDQLGMLGFEAVDPNSPDAAATLANQIEVATAKLAELDKQIHEKKNEYIQKTERLQQLKETADEVNSEYEKVNQLYNDLCEHYGIENNIPHMAMQASDKKDLDSLIKMYNNYIEMQKVNIAKLNVAIKNAKGTPEEIETEVVRYADDESGEKYLESLKNKAKEVDEKYNKAKQLLKDLCEYYGIDYNSLHLQIQEMKAPNTQDTQTLISTYENYIKMQKENIEKINAEIDKLQNPNPQPTTPSFEDLADLFKRAHKGFNKLSE